MAESNNEPVKKTIDIKTATLNIEPNQDLENQDQPEKLPLLTNEKGEVTLNEEEAISTQIKLGLEENIDREVMLIDVTDMNVLTREEVIRRFDQKQKSQPPTSDKVIEFPQQAQVPAGQEQLAKAA